MGWFDTVMSIATGGVSDLFHAAGVDNKTINSFGTLGLSDLKSSPLDLGSSAFKWTDKALGTGELNQDIGKIANVIALLYGGYAAGEGLGAWGGSSAAGEAGATATTAGEVSTPIVTNAGTTTGLTDLSTVAPSLTEAGSTLPTATTGASPFSQSSIYNSLLSETGANGISVANAAGTGTTIAPELAGAAGGLGEAALDTGVLSYSPEAMTIDAGAGTGGTATGGGWSLGSYTTPALMALNLASQYMGAKGQQQAVQDATNSNREWWQENAYPNKAAVNAQASNAYANLASQLVEAKRNMMEDAAKRGLKGGSLAGGLSRLNTSANKNYAQLANQLIQFQNTPQFTPSGLGTNMTPTVTPLANMANSVSGLTGTYLAADAYKNLYGNKQPTYNYNYYGM